MQLVGWCLMPNHFYLLLWPRKDGDLGRWMQWLTTSHVRRYHRHYSGSGHVWQGRFKAFPIQRDEHFLTVLRYVERNPLRAGLVRSADQWPWSSLRSRMPAGDCRWLAAPRSLAGQLDGTRRSSPNERGIGIASTNRRSRNTIRIGGLDKTRLSFGASKPATDRRFKTSRPGNPDLPPNRCNYQVDAALAAEFWGCCDLVRALRCDSEPIGALAGFGAPVSRSGDWLARLRRR